jgi:hypothetical protein
MVELYGDGDGIVEMAMQKNRPGMTMLTLTTLTHQRTLNQCGTEEAKEEREEENQESE